MKYRSSGRRDEWRLGCAQPQIVYTLGKRMWHIHFFNNLRGSGSPFRPFLYPACKKTQTAKKERKKKKSPTLGLLCFVTINCWTFGGFDWKPVRKLQSSRPTYGHFFIFFLPLKPGIFYPGCWCRTRRQGRSNWFSLSCPLLTLETKQPQQTQIFAFFTLLRWDQAALDFQVSEAQWKNADPTNSYQSWSFWRSGRWWLPRKQMIQKNGVFLFCV